MQLTSNNFFTFCFFRICSNLITDVRERKKIALLDSFGDCHLSAKSLKTECSFLNVRERLHCLDKVLVFDLCCAWGWIYVIHAWGWVLFCGTRQLISVMIGLEF